MAAIRKKVSEQVAELLQREIERSTAPTLPSLSVLCKKYGVSRSSMIAAAALLRDKGLLAYSWGQRMRIVKNAEELGLTSEDDLYGRIKEEIIKGTYRIGDLLPKVDFIAVQERVSNHTVLRAYRRLIDEKLVYRKGKSWIVGPGEQRVTRISINELPVILILQRREYDWGWMGKDERTHDFGRTFANEAERRHIPLVYAITGPRQYEKPYPSAYGSDEIRSLIKRLGGRYLGTLIHGSTTEIPDLRDRVRDLVKFGRPVVWFDRVDEPEELDVDSRLFTRCHFSVEKGERLALETLVQLGHRDIGYVAHNRNSWVLERKDRLTKMAEAMPFRVRIFAYDDVDTLNRTLDTATIAELLRTVDHKGTPLSAVFDYYVDRYGEFRDDLDEAGIHAPAVGRYAILAAAVKLMRARGWDHLINAYKFPEYHCGMLNQTALYAHVLRRDAPTAMLAPHDVTARFSYIWLRDAGYDMPGRVSLLSFDNEWQLFHMAFSTVDFGFGHLGYCAFHTILGDIPVKRDRKGNVASKPSIIHRGSLGMPRKDKPKRR